MNVSAAQPFSRTQRGIEITLAVLTSGLFLYAMAQWLDWLPEERPFQPGAFVLLTAALALQSLASLSRVRSRRAFWALLTLAAAALIASLLVAR